MIRFLQVRSLKDGQPTASRGIALSRRDVLALLTGHTLVVRECSQTGVPGMVIFAGESDDANQKRVEEMA